ncbi:MAG: hypothetical protein ACKOCE_01305 [Acidimicrobiia bacterium]
MRRDRDQGSALLMVMVLMVVGGIIATGLLAYSGAVIRARPALHERVAGAEAVKSGTRMAITLQREFGPSGCFADSAQWVIASTPVTATCSTVSSYTTGRGRLGSVVTTNTANTGFLVTPTWAGNIAQALSGEATINTGAMGTSSSLALVRGANGAFSWVASGTPWWQLVGDNNAGAWVYPSLPQVPSYSRPGSQASIGACQLYFPGRYLGATPLTLNGGTHYFASGVYYFERPIVVTGGAQVVFGEGVNAGCAVDAQAAYAPTAPKSHEITGKGATILLGDIATLTVQESSVRINRRVSTASTRGSEGVAVRTVNFGQSNTTVTIPADTVLLADGTTVPVANHSIIPIANTTPVTYRTSTLAPATSWAVDVRLNGTSVSSNRFIVDGYVFVPNAGVRITGTTSVYAVSTTKGTVATRIEHSLGLAPASGGSYSNGIVSETIQRKVRLTVTANTAEHSATSRAIIEVHTDRSYAINSWVIDP